MEKDPEKCPSTYDMGDGGAANGQMHHLRKNFSLFSITGMGFSLANSWFGIATALDTGIKAGGPVQVVYGLILVAIVCGSIAVSLAELSSAMPNAGGQYYWTGRLASPKYARFLSYLTGWMAWTGSIFTCASIALGVGKLAMGCIQLSHPDIEIKAWMIFVSYQVINTFCALFNMYSRTLPLVTQCTLGISLVSFAVILSTIPAKAPLFQSPSFVFETYLNETGWTISGIAFIVGLVNSNWAFNGIDAATHMAEEVLNPERIIPIALPFSVTMMFSMQNFDDVANTATGVPVLELFYQVLQSKAGAIVLTSLIILTGCGCLIASHTWQARLCWSFARDNGLPGSEYLMRIHPSLRVPVWGHLVSSAICSVLGCLYLASYTAFNSMVTAAVVLLYASYSSPVICLLANGRSDFQRGPFWLGPVGMICNLILLAWLLFCAVMYAFPPEYPVSAGNMNYVCVVYFVTFTIIIAWWFVDARRSFRLVQE
ncbi:amino acid/polyamine transporter I [Aspergillus venezuelensis]